MRTKTTLVACKLTPAELAALDELTVHQFQTRSEAILEALHLLFERYHVDPLKRQRMRTERIIHPNRKRGAEPKPKEEAPRAYEGFETIHGK